MLLGFQRSLPVSNCGLPARAELRRPFPRDARSRLPLGIRTGFMDQDTFFQFYGRESSFSNVTFHLLSSLLLDSTVYVSFFVLCYSSCSFFSFPLYFYIFHPVLIWIRGQRFQSKVPMPNFQNYFCINALFPTSCYFVV